METTATAKDSKTFREAVLRAKYSTKVDFI